MTLYMHMQLYACFSRGCSCRLLCGVRSGLHHSDYRRLHHQAVSSLALFFGGHSRMGLTVGLFITSGFDSDEAA